MKKDMEEYAVVLITVVLALSLLTTACNLQAQNRRTDIIKRDQILAKSSQASNISSGTRVDWTAEQVTRRADQVSIAAPNAALVQEPSCTATGDLEIVPFESKIFPVARSLRVLLPAGYRHSANRNHTYPVLYLNDGQDLFDICTSLVNHEEWRVDETVSDLIATGKLRHRQRGQKITSERIPSVRR